MWIHVQLPLQAPVRPASPQIPLLQSELYSQLAPIEHLGQSWPPQSTSVSSPDFKPSMHVAAVGEGVVGFSVGSVV